MPTWCSEMGAAMTMETSETEIEYGGVCVEAFGVLGGGVSMQLKRVGHGASSWLC